jgi:hypothetical protein
LRAELLAMAAEDQRVRQGMGLAASTQQHDEMHLVDSRNARRMDEIITQYGWPGKSLVGADGANRAWLLVQHCDLEFQDKCLPLLEKAVAAGEAAGRDYAYLLDRVLMRHDKPQLYGTQYRTVSGVTTVHPIFEPEQVDVRRQKVGLGPWADYDRKMRGRDGEIPVGNAALRQEVLRLATDAVRLRRGSPSERTEAKRQEIETFDSAATQRVREILAAYGWPGASLVGADAAHEFFRLVTVRSNPALWSECLPLLENAWKGGQATALDFATLTDALRMEQGRLQLYGTVSVRKDGQLELSPIEEPEAVDDRRRAIGLEPLKR